MLALLAALFFAAAPCEAPVRVVGHGVPAGVERDLAAAAPALERKVASALSLTSCAPITVELLPAIEGAADLEPPFLLPAWAAGAAEPGDRRIVVAVTAKGERQDRERILLHELAHLGVREAAGGAPVPRWLDEGVARTLAGEEGRDEEALARARISDSLFPLAALADGFPARGDLAAVAYAESARAVRVIDDAGNDGAGAAAGRIAPVARLLRALGAGASVDDALYRVVGRRTWQVDVDVARSIPKARAWAIVGMQADLAYVLSALVCAWAGLRARRQLKRRMAALDDEGAGLLGPPRDVVLRRFRVTA